MNISEEIPKYILVNILIYEFMCDHKYICTLLVIEL